MFSKLLAIAPLVAFAAAAPALQARATGGQVTDPNVQVSSINGEDGVGAGVDAYTFYQGDGSLGAGWPDKTQWASFEEMFNANRPTIAISCDQFGQADPSDDEIQAIHDGINTVAQETMVDHRMILAVIMQESKGCVRVWSTTSPDGVVNPGLMQDHTGAGNCNTNAQNASGGVVQNPCPNDTITQMIRDGTAGTDMGDGLAQTISQAIAIGDTSGGTPFYRGARIYNSGSIDASGDLHAGVATHCYASDVANRLMGWTGNGSTCTE